MYKVVKYFTDLHDNEHPYNVGDEFPREGVDVTEERLAELAGSDNKQGVPLIELIEELEKTKKPEKPEEGNPEEKNEPVESDKPRGRGSKK